MNDRNYLLNGDNVIDFRKIIQYKNKKRSNQEQDNRDFIEYVELMRKLCEDIKNNFPYHNENASDCLDCNKLDKLKDKDIQIEYLSKELEVLNMKLGVPIPAVIITYIVGSSMAFAFFVTIFILTLVGKLFLLDPFICLICILGSLGLLITSIVSIKDWRNFLKDV